MRTIVLISVAFAITVARADEPLTEEDLRSDRPACASKRKELQDLLNGTMNSSKTPNESQAEALKSASRALKECISQNKDNPESPLTLSQQILDVRGNCTGGNRDACDAAAAYWMFSDCPANSILASDRACALGNKTSCRKMLAKLLERNVHELNAEIPRVDTKDSRVVLARITQILSGEDPDRNARVLNRAAAQQIATILLLRIKGFSPLGRCRE